MGKRSTYNWAEIKIKYISGQDVKLKDLSDEYGMAYAYLRKVAAEGNWASEKDEHWKQAEEDAIKEIGDSTKDLLVRHGQSARYVQVRALRIAKNLLDKLEDELFDELETDQIIALLNSASRMIKNAWKAERELYPKHLSIESSVDLQLIEVSKELKDAVNEALKQRLRSKPRDAS